MRRTRLATGFHRVGLILAVPIAVIGVAPLVTAAFVSSDPATPAILGGAIVAGALLLYVASWAIGWAVRGFMGEEARANAPVSLGAAAVALPATAEVTRPKKAQPPLTGFGGWLVLPALGTILAPFAYAKQSVDLWEIVAKAQDRSHPAFAFVYGEIALNCAMVALCAAALVLMVQRHRWYPRAIIGVMLVGAAVVTADAALAHLLLDVALDPKDWTGIARALFGAAVWVPYMLTSVRVRNTFVN